MNRTIAGGALVSCLVCLGSAQAQSQAGFYAGAALAQLQYRESGVPTATPLAGTLRLGLRVAPYLTSEVRLGTGVASDTVTAGATPITLEVELMTATYLRGMVPVTRELAPYVLVGQAWTQLTANSPSRSVTDATEDFSYGFGLDVAAAPGVRLNFEWVRLGKGPASRIDAVSFGVSINF